MNNGQGSNRDIIKIICHVQKIIPNVEVYQLQKKHAGDDDGLWWFCLPSYNNDDIQIESSDGMCPFLIETNAHSSANARRGDTVEEVVRIIVAHLLEVSKSL